MFSKLLIMDPSLDQKNGHHIDLDFRIALQAKEQGLDTKIVANSTFSPDGRDNIDVEAHFKQSIYKQYGTDPMLGRLDSFQSCSSQLFNDLQAYNGIGQQTGVIFPTVNADALFGIVRWLENIPLDQRPHVFVYLMLASGLETNFLGVDNINYADQDTARLYRMAFRRAAAVHGNIHFFAANAELSEQYSFISGRHVGQYPRLLRVAAADDTAATPEQVLLFTGDAKIEKGFGALPDLVERLCRSDKSTRFVVHANMSAADTRALDIEPKLHELAAAHDNFDFLMRYLSRDEYEDLITSSGIVLMPYVASEYNGKESGILIETMFAGRYPVVPKNSWLARFVSEWDYPATLIEDDTAGAAWLAVQTAMRGLSDQSLRLKEARERFVSAQEDDNAAAQLLSILPKSKNAQQDNQAQLFAPVNVSAASDPRIFSFEETAAPAGLDHAITKFADVMLKETVKLADYAHAQIVVDQFPVRFNESWFDFRICENQDAGLHIVVFNYGDNFQLLDIEAGEASHLRFRGGNWVELFKGDSFLSKVDFDHRDVLIDVTKRSLNILTFSDEADIARSWQRRFANFHPAESASGHV